MLNNIVGLLSDGVVAAANSYESIQTVTVGLLGATSIDFTSIPSTYKHLQIRSFYNNSASNIVMKVTTSGGANTGLRGHLLNGLGSGSGQALAYTPLANGIYIDYNVQTNTTSFYGSIVDILDYSNTNKYKTFRTLFGQDTNGAGEVGINSGFFDTSNAITSITLTSTTVSRIAQYSSFALYGIKG